jgi:putative endonuclease
MYYIQILNLNWLEKYLFLCKEKIMNNYYVYILTRERNSVFYTGVTQDLIGRVYAHKMGMIKGFTQKYNVKQLVYFEHCEDRVGAIEREKTIKKWKRKFKINAIEKMNPQWKDLYYELVEEGAESCLKT